MEKPIYLKRLRTKDGIVGPIQEVFEPRMDELRVMNHKYLPATAIGELPDTSDNMPQMRRYRLKRQTTCVLFEMEED